MTEEFTDKLEADDWKNAAAIVGLVRFFDYAGIPYNRDEIFQAKEVYEEDEEYSEGLDFLKFNAADITEEKEFDFIEHYFREDMHHCAVEDALGKTEWSQDEITFINKKLAANTVMKKFFSEMKFDGTNKQNILDVIRENRVEIIRSTYKNKHYKNFCNERKFRELKKGKTARLKGYYVDFGRKGNSISYRNDSNLFQSSDTIYYNYIPFAFATGSESFFINDNSTIKQLLHTNQRLKEKCEEQIQNKRNFVDTRKVLFEMIIYATNFIDFDVEIIQKNQEKSYFETFYLRRESIEIFKKIKKYNAFCQDVTTKDKRKIRIQEEVTDSVVNLQLLDGLVEGLLKEDTREDKENTGADRKDYTILIQSILNLNRLIRERIYDGGEDMKQEMRRAYKSAREVVAILKSRKQDNKIRAYRTKLLSALVFHDYDRFSEILLNLSNYTDVYFPFAYSLFEDFGANKDAAYTFVNNLNDYPRGQQEQEDADNIRKDME